MATIFHVFLCAKSGEVLIAVIFLFNSFFQHILIISCSGMQIENKLSFICCDRDWMYAIYNKVSDV